MTELLSLKEAYKLRKETEEAKALQEAKELLESYYLVAEKLDTHTISRIVDSMNGVEEALGPVLDKLPSLKSGLDSAEAELVALISGKAGNNPKKTSAMMGKAMAFYQHLSSFLRHDLPVLLRSRVLAGAKAQPDQAVGARITPAFKQALDLEKTGGFIKRLFGSTDIPYVNNSQFAQELTGLTFTELSNLTRVGATPAVLPQAQIDQAAQQIIGSSGMTGAELDAFWKQPMFTQNQTAPQAPATPAAQGTAPPQPHAPAVDPAKQKAAIAKVLEPYMGKKVPDDLIAAITKAATGAPTTV